MTQTTVRRTAPGSAAPAAAPARTVDVRLVPRPRGGRLLPSPVVPAHVPAPAEQFLEPRARRTWLAVGLDLVLALAAAVAVAQLVTLPVGTPLVAAVAWPLALSVAGRYRRAPLVARHSQARLVLTTGARCSVLVLALAPLVSTVDPVAFALLPAAFAVAGSGHALLGRGHRSRVVLLGHPREVREALSELGGRHEVVAACLTKRSRVPLGGLPAYVGPGAAVEVVERHRGDTVVVLPGARLSPAEVRRLHWALADVGAELCVATGLFDVSPDRTRVVATGGLDLLHVAPASLSGPLRWVKDLVERTTAALALVLLSPALLAICVAVRLDSPGPAFYRQTRVGRDGRHFTMLKFRSMRATADEERDDLLARNEADGVLFKIQDDPRITRMGGWLRRWSVDEVPQLWNVVRGDMSLVGPRPALPEEVAQYDVDPARRLVVKPGLTGLWQVSGRSDLSWTESVRLDVKYVDNWSLGLDASIVLRTVRAVLARRGAY